MKILKIKTIFLFYKINCVIIYYKLIEIQTMEEEKNRYFDLLNYFCKLNKIEWKPK